MISPQRPRSDLLFLAACRTGAVTTVMWIGLLAGVLAKRADVTGPVWAGQLGSDVAFWLIALLMIGAWSSSAAQAAARSAVFFAAMCVGYYGWAVEILHYPHTSLEGMWLAAAVTVCPVVASAVWWGIRQGGASGGAVLALTGAAALSDPYATNVWRSIRGGPAPPLHLVEAAAQVVAAVVAVVVLPRSMRARAWATGWLVPAVVLARPATATAWQWFA